MFGKLKFLKGYGATKVQDATTALTEAIVKFDTEGATEATILVMDDNVNQLLKEAAQARIEFEKEKKEADIIVGLYNQRLSAAETLSTQIEEATTAGDTKKVNSLTKSLEALLTMIEDMADDVEREKQEAVDAQEILEELEGAAKEGAEQLKDARAEIKKAAQGMKKAQLAEERAKKKRERAELASGVRKTGSGLNVALEAMKKQTEESTANADASAMKARLLKPEGGIDEDPNILAAMGGASDTSTLSISDRLAGLKKKKK